MHIHTHVCVYIYKHILTYMYIHVLFFLRRLLSILLFFVFYLVHRTLRVWSLSSTQPMNLQQHEAYSYSQYQHLNCHSHWSSHQTQSIQSRKHLKCQPHLIQNGHHIIPCWFMTPCRLGLWKVWGTWPQIATVRSINIQAQSMNCIKKLYIANGCGQEQATVQGRQPE